MSQVKKCTNLAVAPVSNVCKDRLETLPHFLSNLLSKIGPPPFASIVG